MKILKPDSLALLYRALRLGGHDVLSIGMMAMFRFDASDREHLLSEPELWKHAGHAIGADAVLDDGLPKPAAEFLAYGACHAPPGGEATELLVSVTVGTRSKQLRVTGDRQAGPLPSASKPQPFRRMPIDPAHAYGGPGYPDNPAGKGFAGDAAARGDEPVALPNVEVPGTLRDALRARVAPAGFWGWPVQAPQRGRHLGAVGDAWLRTTWPHLPVDTAPAFFHSAPEDQRFDGYLRGDEPLEMVHLHPRDVRLVSRLPGLRARCFVNRQVDGQQVFSELDARAETVWLFPELECGIVLYRACARVADVDADDVLHVFAGWERLEDAPLAFEHYRDAFQRQIGAASDGADAGPAMPGGVPAAGMSPVSAAPATAVVAPALGAAVTTAPVAAAAVDADIDPMLAEVNRMTAQLESDRQALMLKHGLTEADVQAWMPSNDPIPEVSLAELEGMTARLQAQTQRLLDQHGLTEQDLAKFMPAAEPPPAGPAELARAVTSLAQQKDAILQKAGLTEQDVQRFVDSRPDLAELGEMLRQPKPDPQQIFADLAAAPAAAIPAAATAAAVSLPDVPPPAARAPAEDEPVFRYPSREAVMEAHARRVSFAGQDVSELDLSGLDLSGADFSGALLTQTRFAGARLAHARFDDALLQRADFSDADLSAARMSNASADGAIFVNARMDGSDLGGAQFGGADFSDARLSGASLARAMFAGARLTAVKAASCDASAADFSECDLSRADLAGARLARAQFVGARCGDANFSKACCDEVDFGGADCRAATFAEASLRASRAMAGTRFDGALFTQARMERASWGGASLDDADFSGALLDNADMSRVQAMRATFARASAKGARFDKGDLRGADLDGINLFNGSLRHARLDGTRLRHANLYGVDFDEARPGVAGIEGSNIDRTILKFRPPTA